MSNEPQGWASAALDEITEVNPRHPKNLDGHMPVTFVPMAAISEEKPDFQYTEERPLGEVRKSFTHFAERDVLFAKITPCMENGKGAVARGLRNQLGCGTTELHVIRPLADISPDYIYRFLAQRSVRRSAKENFTGTAGQARVPTSFIEELEIPLAPLAEQRRIVTKLEKLLTQVDTSQRRLARIPALLRRFRQSVLAAACSGRLTADWREENHHIQTATELLRTFPIERKPAKKRAGRLWGAGEVPQLTDEELESLPSTWVWTKVGELGYDPADAVQVGPMSMQSRDFTEKGVPVLNVGCVQWNGFDESKLDYMPEKKAAVFSRYRIAAHDILFTRSGTVGRCALATPRQDGWLMTFHLLRVRPNPRKCCPKYLLFALRGSPNVLRQTTGAAIGSTRAGFNTRLLAELDVPLPPFVEQQEIVRRVEEFFALANRIEARFAVGRKRVDSITQAILAKAFRGELVPTEAELASREGRSYESAPELLGRIRASAVHSDNGLGFKSRKKKSK